MIIWKIILIISYLVIVYGIIMNIKLNFVDVTDKYDYFIGAATVLIYLSLIFLTLGSLGVIYG